MRIEVWTEWPHDRKEPDMRSSIFIILPVALLMLPASVPAEEVDLGEFEMWEQVEHSRPGATPSDAIAKVGVVGQADPPPAPSRTQEVSESAPAAEQSEDEDYVILFGAGASMVVPYRVTDGATGSKTLSEFSVSWAPFGLVGEIGVDLAIARNSSFVFRPNLKFYFAKYEMFSVYFEGTCAIYSGPSDTHVGGGGGLGLIFGLMKHLALELRAGGTIFSMSAETSNALVDRAPSSSPDGPGPSLVFLPSVGARLIARF
jgi:hypothetical protein